MDGCLTDFDRQFRKFSGGLSPEEYKRRGEVETSLLKKVGQGFWSELEWIQGGRELYDVAVSHFEVVRILSSAGTGKDVNQYKIVQRGKIEWLEKNIPSIEKRNIIIVPFASLKSRHSGTERILVDDKLSTINQWDLKGGIGLLHDAASYKKTLRKLIDLATGDSGKISLKEIVQSL
jgi:5'(3')-deoxyribonucleotidase